MGSLINGLFTFFVGFIAIGIVVLFHEIGHFIMARARGVDVETFSIGMGPKLFSLKGRKTEVRVSLIPFGGYCSMKGSIDLIKAIKAETKSFDLTEEGSFFATSSITRMLIFLSGPLSSLLLTFILFIIVGLIPVETISNPARIVLASDYFDLYGKEVTQSELKTGDLILTAGGIKIASYEEFENYLANHKGENIDLTLLRDGEEMSAQIASIDNLYGITLYLEPIVGKCVENPYWMEGDVIAFVDGHEITNTNDFYRFAVAGAEVTVLRDGKSVTFSPSFSSIPFSWHNNIVIKRTSSLRKAIPDGFTHTKEILASTLSTLLKLFSDNAEEGKSEITGPTRAAQSVGNIAIAGLETSLASGIRALLYLMAVVSVSLFVANILPIPSFDGGQVLLNLINLIRRKSITPREYIVYQILGLATTGLIMLYLYSSDIIHYLS